MKQQPQNQASGASETTRFFCTQISPAASAAGELKQHKKEPNMANKKKTPLPASAKVPIPELCTTPSPRARVRVRVVCHTGILIISHYQSYHARVRTHARKTANRPKCSPNGVRRSSAAISIPSAWQSMKRYRCSVYVSRKTTGAFG